MKIRETNPNTIYVRTTGIIAIIAALANGIGDIFYQGVPDGVYDTNMEFMWKVSLSNLNFGAYFGLFIIPFALAGYWHVYQGIKRAGRWLTLPPILFAVYTIPIGCAAHFGLYYPAIIGHQIIGSTGETYQILNMLHSSLNDANNIIFLIYQLGVALFSLWLMLLIFFGKTRYPRWFGVMNPLFLTIAYTFLVSLIPKYEAYLHPASAISDAVFFTVSTILLWRNES